MAASIPWNWWMVEFFTKEEKSECKNLVRSILFVFFFFAFCSIINVWDIPFPFSIQGSGQLGEEKPGEEVLLAVLRCQVEQASDLLVLETGAGAGVL